jgi:HEAT repeat protein
MLVLACACGEQGARPGSRPSTAGEGPSKSVPPKIEEGRYLDPNLLARLKSADRSVRAPAIVEVVEGRGLEGVPYLIEAMREKGDVMYDATSGVVHLGRAATPFLIGALKHAKDDGIMSGCVMALGALGVAEPVTIRALLSAVAMTYTNSDYHHVGHNARVAIRGFGADAVPGLVDALEDADPYISGPAAALLGEIGLRPDIAVPALVRVLRDPRRKAHPALYGLAGFGPAALAAAETVRSVAQDPDREETERSAARETLAGLLGHRMPGNTK